MSRLASIVILGLVPVFLLLVDSPKAAAVDCDGVTAGIVGTSGPDRKFGGPSRNVIQALEGSDYAFGSGGNDLVCGHDGNDLVGGDKYYRDGWNDPPTFGADRLHGGPGCDVVLGDAKGDDLFGDSGSDLPPIYGGCSLPDAPYYSGGVKGGGGDDYLLGEGGSDYLHGGSGTDSAVGGNGFDYCEAIEVVNGCESFL